jgi:hypothetical protein
MASKDQLEQWKALGGKVEEAAKKGAKKDTSSTFISPSGALISSAIVFGLPLSTAPVTLQGKS